MTPILAAALLWTWMSFWMVLLSLAIARAAYHHTGWPICRPTTCRIIGGKCRWRIIKWPISGRWLLTGLIITVTFMITDVMRVTWVIWSSDVPTTVEWESILFRFLPSLFAPWTFWRQIRRGLTNDYRT